MDRRTHAAHTLAKCPCVARIAPDENLLQPAHHRAGAEGVRDHPVLYHGLDAQMAFNSSDWVDNYACHDASLFRLIVFVFVSDHALLANVGQYRMGPHAGQCH